MNGDMTREMNWEMNWVDYSHSCNFKPTCF